MYVSIAGPSNTRNPMRTGVLLVIAGMHAGAIAAFASVSAWREITSAAQALEVQIVREAPPRPVEPLRSVPPPNMRPPEIHIPLPPVVENAITIRMDEAKPPAPPAPVQVAVVAAPPAPAEPAMQPPRGDIAYLNNPAPSYPAVSRRSREQGRVMLRVRVDEKGNVENVEVQSSSGFTRLDEAARDAVRRWRFQPARMGERAVAGTALVPINFQLS